MLVFPGKRVAEQHNKSPDLPSWGAPVLLKAEIPLKSLEGENFNLYLKQNLKWLVTDFRQNT